VALSDEGAQETPEKAGQKVFFATLDAICMQYFGGAIEGVPDGFTASLVTVCADGWPITSLLGPGELFAIDDRHLAIALWPASRAQQNMLRTGRASLDFVADTRFYQLQLTRLHSQTVDGSMLIQTALHGGEAQSVPYAALTNGIQYRLQDPLASLDRWQRQRGRLRSFTQTPSLSDQA
jgi:hypothetical protein